MVIKLPIGDKQEVEVREPTRGMFPANLGGAVEYSFAHLVYNVLEVMGGALGSFIAGMGVQFLERIEPSLVEYAEPLINLILKQADLDPDLRLFFTRLQTPAHEGAAAILGGLASQTGGMALSSLLGVLLAKPTQALNAKIMPAIADPAALIAMARRGKVPYAGIYAYMAKLGYPADQVAGFEEITRSRAGLGDWIDAQLRGIVSSAEFYAEGSAQGFTMETSTMLAQLHRRLMQLGDMLPALYRRELSESDLRATMVAQGWKDSDVTTMLAAAKPLPPLADAIQMGVREAWRDDVASRWGYDEDYPAQVGDHLAKLGYDPDWARRYWRAHWQLPSVTLGMEMLHRGIISGGEFDEMLKIADYPAGWRGKMTQAAYTPYTRVDVRRMYKMGIVDRAGVKRTYMDLGYDDAHAEGLTEFTVNWAEDDPEEKTTKYKTMTTSLLQQAYYKNLIGMDELIAQLVGINYPQAEAEMIAEITEARRVVEKTPDYTVEYRRDVKAVIERSYYKGMIDAATATRYLTEAELTPPEIEYCLAASDLARGEATREAQIKVIADAYASRAIDRTGALSLLGKLDLPATEQERLLSDWDTAISLGARRLTEAQYRLALRSNVIDRDGYQEAIRGLGYSEPDVAILMQLAQPTEG